jgi:predicted phage tail protein
LIDAQDVTGTSFTPTTPLLAGHKYTAQVRAFDGSGNATGWSAPFPFTIVLPAKPVVTGPTGPVHTTLPTITWDAVEGADHYDLWVNDATKGKSQVIREQDVTDASFTPTEGLHFGHTYTVRVRAVNAAGQSGKWSKWFHFRVTLPPAPAIPTVTGPSGSGVSQTPDITWTDVTGAEHYDLRVDDLTAGKTKVVWEEDLTTTSYTPTSDLISGHRYQVEVRSVDDLGQTRGWSKAVLFTVL